MAQNYDEVTLSENQMQVTANLLKCLEASGADSRMTHGLSERDYQTLKSVRVLLEAALDETRVVVDKRERRASSLAQAGQ